MAMKKAALGVFLLAPQGGLSEFEKDKTDVVKMTVQKIKDLVKDLDPTSAAEVFKSLDMNGDGILAMMDTGKGNDKSGRADVKAMSVGADGSVELEASKSDTAAEEEVLWESLQALELEVGIENMMTDFKTQCTVDNPTLTQVADSECGSGLFGRLKSLGSAMRVRESKCKAEHGMYCNANKKCHCQPGLCFRSLEGNDCYAPGDYPDAFWQFLKMLAKDENKDKVNRMTANETVFLKFLYDLQYVFPYHVNSTDEKKIKSVFEELEKNPNGTNADLVYLTASMKNMRKATCDEVKACVAGVKLKSETQEAKEEWCSNSNTTTGDYNGFPDRNYWCGEK